MKRIFLAVAFAAASLSVAHAADYYPPAPRYAAPAIPASYNWTGFYIGGNLGYASGDVRNSNNFASTEFGTRGMTGGLQAGYNWQAGSVVAGFEASAQFAGITGDIDTATCKGCSDLTTTKLNSFWTVGPRIGYDINGFLPYIGGGLAASQMEVGNQIGFGGKTLYSSTTKGSANGYYLQAGIDYRINRDWSAGVDFKWLKLNPGSFTDSTGFAVDNKVEQKILAIRFDRHL